MQGLRNPRVAIDVIMTALVLAITACSTMPRDFETPKVSIANIVPKDMTLMEQRFDVQLRIQNPNNFDLGINGARFDIELNGTEFGNGLSGAKVTVPRFSSEVMSGEVITGLGSMIRQAQGLSSGVTKVQYRLKGKAFAESPGSFVIPFDEHGEINLNVESPADK